MKTLILPLLVCLFMWGCNSEPKYPYAEQIRNCMDEVDWDAIEDEYFDNPARPCLQANVVGQQFPNYTFVGTDKVFTLNEAFQRPVVIYMMSRKDKDSRKHLHYLNNFLHKYRSEVGSIIMIERKEDGFSDVLFEASSGTGPLKFHRNSEVVYYDADDVKLHGNTATIHGIEFMGYPTTYYLSQDKNIVDLETGDDLVIAQNLVMVNDLQMPEEEMWQEVAKRMEEKFQKMLQ